MARPSKQEVEDMREQAKLEDAYNRSLNTTEIPAPPKPPASAPVKKAKGGFVSAADGVAQRGKTKGRII